MRCALSIAVTLLLGAGLGRGEAWAQEPHRLTARDSVELRLTALEEWLRVLDLDDDAPRIWLVAYGETDPVTRERVQIGLTEAERSAILEAFPTVREADSADELFFCPEGVRVQLPGTGCPIREDGVIVSFGRLNRAGDSVRTVISLTRSIEEMGRQYTWQEGGLLIFRYVEGRWRFLGVRERGIT